MPHFPSRSRIDEKRNVLPTTFPGARRLAFTMTPRKVDGESSGDHKIFIDLHPSLRAENGRIVVDNPNPIVIVLLAVPGSNKVKVIIEADPAYSVDRGSVYERKKGGK